MTARDEPFPGAAIAGLCVDKERERERGGEGRAGRWEVGAR